MAEPFIVFISHLWPLGPLGKHWKIAVHWHALVSGKPLVIQPETMLNMIGAYSEIPFHEKLLDNENPINMPYKIKRLFLHDKWNAHLILIDEKRYGM